MFLLIILDKFERHYVTLCSGILVLTMLSAACIGVSANVVGTSVLAKCGYLVSWGRYCNNCCIFCGDFLSCFLNGLFAAILSSLMSNIRCPILSLEIVDVGFALYRLQLREIGFPLRFTFSVNRLIGVDNVMRCSANIVSCIANFSSIIFK